ncbi:MAG: hydrogenase formation protein HypD [Candidatus Sumerlaeia bacterium]|nr:hydrogenase formation protein HypD [Candidatus Sumerlaeia bacterium]
MSDRSRVQSLCREIAHWADAAGRPLTLMEICGTHTMAIYRHGIRTLLPESVTLISGPGCPVCVTPQSQIDLIVELARRPEVTVATFGDIVRVPGTQSSLEQERSRGADVRIVYSAHDAVQLAQAAPVREVVFVAIGFETTAPTVAAAVAEARERGVHNFSILPANKTIPPAIAALLKSGEVKLDGLICPGHVSVIIGSDAYQPYAAKYRIPCAVAGFEPVEVLEAIVALVRQAAEGRAEVENLYGVWVKPHGNRRAQEMIHAVFTAGPSRWRGLGVIEGSGLFLRGEYAAFDAMQRFGLVEPSSSEPAGCRCGDVLCGRIRPADCPLFACVCTPDSPVGPCMVSTEGSCSAAYRYGRRAA